MAPHPRLLASSSRVLAAGSLIVACCLAAGCSTLETYVPRVRSLGVYKIDINQGNYLTRDQVEKLKEGQSKVQVKAILGTPLVVSVFRDSRWDYVYGFERQGKQLERRSFTVYFDGDKLVRWEGDEMPQSVAEVNRAAIDKSLGHVPSADDPGWFDWLFKIFKR